MFGNGNPASFECIIWLPRNLNQMTENTVNEPYNVWFPLGARRGRSGGSSQARRMCELQARVHRVHRRM